MIWKRNKKYFPNHAKNAPTRKFALKWTIGFESRQMKSFPLPWE